MEKHNQKKKKKDLNGMTNIRNATKSQKEKKKKTVVETIH